MRRHDLAALTAALVGIFASAAQSSDIGHEIAAQIDVVSYQYFLDELLFTHYGDDRGPEGPEHDPARDNIAATFESYGFEVELHRCYSWYYPDGLFYNVVATKTGAIWPDRQYIVGAHYDSVSNPGADDDASGVAGLLELARVYSQYDTGCTLKLIAFDLEEEGLRGSSIYAYQHAADDIRGMIQLDMIAWDYLRYKVMIRAAVDDTPQLAYDLDLAVEEYGGELLGTVGSPVAASDHASFADIEVPACLLIEHRYDLNPCYHQWCDSVDEPNYISYDYAADIVRSVAGYLADIAPAYYADDCNQDGISDAQQIQDDPSLDCNENGFLDECEPGGTEDCNANGVPDLCDIYFGTSDDLDGNIVPDECQPHRYVPAEYPTIQAAIDAADATDVIVVADDTYTGDGNIDVDFLGKDVVLRSENGPENCIIDCAGVGRGFYLGTGETSAAVISGFTITNGSSLTTGGAIACQESSPTILDCVLFNNTAGDGGGIFCSDGRPTIRNCTITQNAADHGGGLCCLSSRPRIEDSVISGNTANRGGAIYDEDGRITLVRSALENNIAIGDGGGICLWFGSKPTIQETRIANNSSGSEGGGIYDYGGGKLVISTCEISANSADGAGGGVWIDTYATATIDTCAIFGNSAGQEGGGLYIYGGQTVLRNCTITLNEARDGAGLYRYGGIGPATIMNCTIARNRATYHGGGLYWDTSSSLTITNSILWHDHPDEIYLAGSGVSTITYSVVEGGWEGVGNIDDEPMITADGKHLLAGSPCINAGDPNGVYADTLDIDGEPRDGDERVDIGPDEFYDVDTDQLPDWWEQLYFGSPTAATPDIDSDTDGWRNVHEYELGSNPLQPPATYYVAVDGDDSWDGLAPEWDGEHGPKASIQAAIDVADWLEPDVVIALPGVHTAHERFNMINFHGKPTTLRSIDPLDPAVVATTIIDRQAQEGQGRIFSIRSTERPETTIAGLTICNARTALGGAVRCRGLSSPTFSRCIFRDNRSTDSGAAVHCSEQSEPRFQNCVFANNAAASYGGAVYSEDASPRFTSCMFVANAVGGRTQGSALCLVASDVELTNCTVTGNASDGDAVLACSSTEIPGQVTATGCILWDGDDTISHDPNSVVTIAYSTVYGGWPGDGNIDVDPLFFDPDGPDDDPNTWEDNDYRLSTGSPCIDAGDNTAVPSDLADLDADADRDERVPFDLDGYPRFIEDPFTPNTGVADPPDYRYVVDMGAYEFQFCYGDLDDDGQVGLSDLAALLGHYGTQTGATYYDGDLDSDGDVDLADLAELLGWYGTECP